MRKENNALRMMAILFLIIILLVTPILADPPFITQEAEAGGLDITFPTGTFFKPGQNFTISYHVFNTTGSLITDADCLFHMYNSTDNLHIYEEYLNTSDEDYEIIIDGAKTLVPGTYPVLLSCNTTTLAGFASSAIYITPLGESFPDDLSPLAVIILVPLIFGIVCVIGVFAFSEDNWQFKLAMYLLGLISSVVSLLLGVQVISMYYVSSELQSTIAHIALVIGLFIFAVIMILGIIFLTALLKSRKDKKIQRWLE